MRDVSHTYMLRRYSGSLDPDYHAALDVYLKTVSPDIRTSSNEITQWLDRSYREYGDDFCVCGFYADGKVIGFAEFAFFRRTGLLFLDYLSLHPDYQSQSEYFQFTRMVWEWIERESFEYDFAATEITFENSGPEPTERSRLEVELYKQMGFGIVHCKYRQPPLGLLNTQSDLPAYLMIRGRQPISVVRAETVLQLTRTIYFEHYLRWYTPFLLENINEYKNRLEERFEEVKEGLKGLDDVEVNGMKMFAPSVPQAIQPKEAASAVRVSLIILFSLLIFLSCLLLLYRYTQAPWQQVVVIFAGSLLAFVAIFSLFHEPSRRILDSLLTTLIRIFGRQQ
jgi:hypothetical protein